MEIKVGNIYTLNEDINNFVDLKPIIKPQKIKAGTKCKVIEKTGEYVTIDINGLKVRTETHMLD